MEPGEDPDVGQDTVVDHLCLVGDPVVVGLAEVFEQSRQFSPDVGKENEAEVGGA